MIKGRRREWRRTLRGVWKSKAKMRLDSVGDNLLSDIDYQILIIRGGGWLHYWSLKVTGRL